MNPPPPDGQGNPPPWRPRGRPPMGKTMSSKDTKKLSILRTLTGGDWQSILKDPDPDLGFDTSWHGLSRDEKSCRLAMKSLKWQRIICPKFIMLPSFASGCPCSSFFCCNSKNMVSARCARSEGGETAPTTTTTTVQEPNTTA